MLVFRQWTSTSKKRWRTLILETLRRPPHPEQVMRMRMVMMMMTTMILRQGPRNQLPSVRQNPKSYLLKREQMRLRRGETYLLTKSRLQLLREAKPIPTMNYKLHISPFQSLSEH